MRASRSPYAQLLRARAQFVGEGWTPGRLYHLGRYPGAVFGDDCTNRVHGELFLLRGDTLLVALDAYEGCGGQGTKPDLFYRDVVEVSACARRKDTRLGLPVRRSGSRPPAHCVRPLSFVNQALDQLFHL